MGTLEGYSNVKVPLLCFTGGLATGLIMNRLLKGPGGSDEKLPEKWIRVGEISQLLIHPVKSLPGISVEKAIVTELGLQDPRNLGLRDRTFLIVNDKGVFQHQRIMPSLALITTRVVDKSLYLKGPSGVEVKVDIPTFDGSNRKTVRIWYDKVKSLDCGDEVANWLTNATGSETPLRLVYHEGELSQRKIAPVEQGSFPMFHKGALGTFQDETSYMMMTEESLDFLNTLLEEKPVTVRNFRPCMLMKGAPEPWAEDFWSYIRVGDGPMSPVFKTAKPCQRCKLTTIDPDTGIVREDGEPVKTLTNLQKQRTVGDETVTKLVRKSAIMGTHFGVFKNPGTVIQIGDPVYTAVV